MSAVPVMTPAVPAVSAQDLELEHAELIPPRETLLACRFYPDRPPPCPGGPVYWHPGLA